MSYYEDLRSIINGESTTSDVYIQRAIDEATYYGRNQYLLKGERILDEMIELGKKYQTMTGEFAKKQYELEEIFKKVFGFESFTLNSSIMQLCPLSFLYNSLGACTIVQASYIKYAKMATPGGITYVVDFDKNHKGVAFKKDAKYKMNMFLGMDLFMDYGPDTLTGAEIMAITLHEIGHNFYVGPVREITTDVVRLLSFGDLTTMLSGELIFLLLTTGSREVDARLGQTEKSFMRQVGTIVGTVGTPILQIKRLLNAIRDFNIAIEMLNGAIYFIRNVPSKILKGAIGYDAEKYSDAFAAAYGYSSELASALMKIQNIHIQPLKDVQGAQLVINFIKAFGMIPWLLIETFIDEHPNNQQRLRNQIKFMEQAASSVKDPKLRAEYQRDLQRLYTLRDEVRNYSGVDSIKLLDKGYTFFQDTLRLEDPRELISAFNSGKYKNIDM